MFAFTFPNAWILVLLLWYFYVAACLEFVETVILSYHVVNRNACSLSTLSLMFTVGFQWVISIHLSFVTTLLRCFKIKSQIGVEL